MSKTKKTLSDLIPDSKNFNKGTAQGDILLTKSIEEFGFREAATLDVNGVLIGGNKRTAKAGQLGFEEVEIIKADSTKVYALQYDDIDITTEKGRRLALALNQTASKNILIDAEMVEAELSEAVCEEWGVNTDKILAEAEEDDFDVPEGGIETDIVLGDLFEIGEHRLLCGDSTCSDTVAKLMNGEKADMVFTDPPYNINYGNIKHSKFKQREIENDNMSGQEFMEFCHGFASNIKLFCNGIIYCWAGPGADGRIMFTVLDNMFHCSTMIVWNKDQFTLGRGKYQNKHEVCWFGWNENGSSFTEDRTLTNVWDFARHKKSELHPTMKPIELVENGLKHASKTGDKVLDLFLGSGSTMVASHQLKRKCYGMELDPKYCQVIVDRMKKLDPTLEVKRNGIKI